MKYAFPEFVRNLNTEIHSQVMDVIIVCLSHTDYVYV